MRNWLAIDYIGLFCGLWFVLLGWLVLAGLVGLLPPLDWLFELLVGIADRLAALPGALHESLPILGWLAGAAVLALYLLAILLVLLLGWGLLPIWCLVGLGFWGERRNS